MPFLPRHPSYCAEADSPAGFDPVNLNREIGCDSCADNPDQGAVKACLHGERDLPAIRRKEFEVRRKALGLPGNIQLKCNDVAIGELGAQETKNELATIRFQ